MRRRGHAAVALALLATGTAGCSIYLGRAERAYHQGRYLETAESLAQHEPDVPYLSEGRQAIYGLYRGLSLLHLGDVEGARRWLAVAVGIERARPGTLRDDERFLLAEGLARAEAVPPPRSR